ncbi:glycosyltransferase family 4 protein [Pseudomonas sp. 2FE]|uniref:glycosyltransferase family 4 protein n=1 Tax=Pseudomonas sp. 2FE TaxID=2502190 RepID=UPI0010F57048|nr:glycosyltransferase family 4 protein [Pseudomonas sp. 2FE]
MSKGTIIYMGGFELPDKNAAAHRVVANGKIMRNLGYEVVFVGMNKSNGLSENFVRCDQDFFGFECWSIPYPAGFISWIKYILGLPEILDFVAAERPNKVVGVICYNYPAVAQLRINSLCRKRGIKHFADATEWYDASGGNLMYRVVKWLDTSLRIHVVNARSDGVITTSKFMTSFYAKRNKRTVELPTLFDADKFQAPPIIKDRLRRKFIYVGIPFDIGRINKNRTNLKERLDLSILLFSKLYEEGELFDFVIYGVSKDEYLTVFPEHHDLLIKMADCVHFNGRQPNKVVLDSIADSDVSIFFRDETRVTLAGFPSKLAESISCGTPVLSNKMVSIEDYAGLGSLFLAEKGEELSVIKGLMRMSMQEINELKAMSFESRFFDYRRFQARFESFFKQVGI